MNTCDKTSFQNLSNSQRMNINIMHFRVMMCTKSKVYPNENAYCDNRKLEIRYINLFLYDHFIRARNFLQIHVLTRISITKHPHVVNMSLSIEFHSV